MQKNIRMHYMYRDAGNYKQFGEVVFFNAEQLSIKEIKDNYKIFSFDEIWFNPSKIKIRALQIHPYDDELDHDLHEMIDFEETNDDVNDLLKRSISLFLESLKCTPFF